MPAWLEEAASKARFEDVSCFPGYSRIRYRVSFFQNINSVVSQILDYSLVKASTPQNPAALLSAKQTAEQKSTTLGGKQQNSAVLRSSSLKRFLSLPMDHDHGLSSPNLVCSREYPGALSASLARAHSSIAPHSIPASELAPGHGMLGGRAPNANRYKMELFTPSCKYRLASKLSDWKFSACSNVHVPSAEDVRCPVDR